MPFAFAELRPRTLVLGGAAALVGGGIALAVALAPPAAPPRPRSSSPSSTASIDAAERASIGARLAYVSEADGHRRARSTDILGRDDVELDVSAGDSYPAASTTDGAVVVLRARGAEEANHEEALVRIDPRTKETRVLAHASRIRNPVVAADGAIAFESDASSFRDLFTVKRGETAVTRLTDNPEGNYEPSFFADGSALVFTSSRDGNAEIYSMRADGREPRRLTSSVGDDLRPLVSHDGRRIAFVSGRTGDDRIFVMGPNGDGQRLLRAGAAGDSEREATFSPDGQSLAFVVRGRSPQTAKSRIFRWDASRDVATALTDGTSVCDMPAFSPDGRLIAFVSDRDGGPDVWLMRSNGTGAVRLFPSPPRPGQKRWLPVWVSSGH